MLNHRAHQSPFAMSLLQSFQLDHLPEDFAVHIALYQNVRNAAFLQQQLLQGNTDFEYAFIDASAVCCKFDLLCFCSPQSDHAKILSSTHLLAAIFRAANDKFNDRLKSKNVHAEMVFCLSMNNNVRCIRVTTSSIPDYPQSVHATTLCGSWVPSKDITISSSSQPFLTWSRLLNHSVALACHPPLLLSVPSSSQLLHL